MSPVSVEEVERLSIFFWTLFIIIQRGCIVA